MVRLAVGGHEIQVDDDHIEGLVPARAGTPKIRHCWAATTAEYDPVLVLELAGGLMITGGGAAGDPLGVVPAALPWARIASIRSVDQAWMMVIGLIDGATTSLLFASVGELHRVVAAVGESWGAAAATSRPVDPAASIPGSDPVAASVTSASARCAEPKWAGAPRHPRSRARGQHRPSPALDRIERRLASVESMLADLTTSTHPRGS